MNIRTTAVDGKIVDVLTEQEYRDKIRFYNENPSMATNAAVEVPNSEGIKYVLPFRGKTDDRPGLYQAGSIYFTRFPDAEQDAQYRSDKLDIVDFNDATTVSDFLQKNNQIRDMEANILSDIDVVFAPTITQADTREMAAVKEAITSKHMDIGKYAQRFGDNFLNDKRILRTNSITMNKLISICKKLDIEAELTLRNTSPDVANPMPREISVILTGDGGEEDQ